MGEKKCRLYAYMCICQEWESSSFCWKSGFLMVPGVILEIHINLGRKFVCIIYRGFPTGMVYLKYDI